MSRVRTLACDALTAWYTLRSGVPVSGHRYVKVESGMYAAALIILAGGGTQVRIPSVLLATVAAGTRLESTGDPVTGDIIFRVRRPS